MCFPLSQVSTALKPRIHDTSFPFLEVLYVNVVLSVARHALQWFRAHAQANDGVGSTHAEFSSVCSTRVKVLEQEVFPIFNVRYQWNPRQFSPFRYGIRR